MASRRPVNVGSGSMVAFRLDGAADLANVVKVGSGAMRTSRLDGEQTAVVNVGSGSMRGLRLDGEQTAGERGPPRLDYGVQT